MRDILDIERPPTPELTKEAVLNAKKRTVYERYVFRLKIYTSCPNKPYFTES